MKKKSISAERLAVELIFENQWAMVAQEDFRMNTGHEGRYLIVERTSGVMILPIIEENGTRYTYLVKQFRYPLGKEIWQFPMGSLEQGIEPLAQAKRELKEETGLVVEDLHFATEYYVDPGLSRQTCFVYVADRILRQEEQELDGSEQGMEVRKFSLSEVEAMIESEEIADSWVYAGMYILKQFLKKKKQ